MRYAFDPGTLPPGAQSLGEQQRIVSHTNPRVPRAAGTLLDRLVQAIWTEPSQEDHRNHGSGDEPHTDDVDMQVDTEGGSETTGMARDRAPEEDPANTPAATGVAGEGHGNGSIYPATPQCDAGEAQDGRNYHSTESPLEGGHVETQASSTAELDEHGMGGTVHTQKQLPAARWTTRSQVKASLRQSHSHTRTLRHPLANAVRAP